MQFCRKTIEIFSTQAAAGWEKRCRLEAGAQFGVAFHGIEAFVEELGKAILGPPLDETQLLANLQEVLRLPDHAAGFRLIAGDDRAAVLVRRAMLAEFMAWARANAPDVAGANDRDRALLAVFTDLNAQVRQLGSRVWHAGMVDALLEAGAAGAPMVRDVAEIVVHSDAATSKWVLPWLEKLAPGRVRQVVKPQPGSTGPVVPKVHACASPEAEILAVARLLYADPRPTAVIVPADEVPRWAARLQSHGVPVLANQRYAAGQTLSERVLATMAELQRGAMVSRGDLDVLLFSAVLAPWPATGEKATIKRDIQRFMRGVRRSNGNWQHWLDGVGAVQSATNRELKSQREKGLADEASTELRLQEVERNGEAIREFLGKVADANTCAAVVAVLKSWNFLKNASQREAEGPAAQAIVAQLNAGGDTKLTEQWPKIAAALHVMAGDGWIDETAPDFPPCWVIPWGAVPNKLPRRCVLAGLDRVPAAANEQTWLTAAALDRLGLPTTATVANAALAEVERVWAASEIAALSYRTRDGQGSAVAPSAWLAQMLARSAPAAGAGLALHVIQFGRDSLTAPTVIQGSGAATVTPTDCAPADPVAVAGLERRRTAIANHGAPTASAWTGKLGVRVRPQIAGFSVSALQVYAANPYRYFLQTLLGLREEDLADDSFDAREQGNLIHKALETPMKTLLADGPVDILESVAELWTATEGAIHATYKADAEGLLAAQVWQGEAGRWRAELSTWFTAVQIRAAKWVTQSAENATMDATKSLRLTPKGWRQFMANATEANGAATLKAHGLDGRSKLGKSIKDWLDQTTDESRARCEIAMDDYCTSAQAEIAKEATKLASDRLKAAYRLVVAIEHQLHTADRQPLALALGNDAFVLPMRGLIDRVEYSPEDQALAVVDYKTGKVDTGLAAKIVTGEHLQLPLYAVALEQQVASNALASKGVPPGAKVAKLRLEFLKRNRTAKHAVVAVDPTVLLPPTPDDGPAAKVQKTALDWAQGHARNFAAAIGEGHLPLVTRAGTARDDAITAVMRFVPVAAEDKAGAWVSRRLEPDRAPAK